jgi:hypothetical protein
MKNLIKESLLELKIEKLVKLFNRTLIDKHSVLNYHITNIFVTAGDIEIHHIFRAINFIPIRGDVAIMEVVVDILPESKVQFDEFTAPLFEFIDSTNRPRVKIEFTAEVRAKIFESLESYLKIVDLKPSISSKMIINYIGL